MSTWKNIARPAALVGAGVVAGGLLAASLTASADPTPGPSAPAGARMMPGDGDPAHSQRPDEKLLTGDTASKVRAAVLAKYPGATIERVETDSDGVYEAHLVTKAGLHVTVEVNKSFAVTGEERHGPGMGGPGGPCRPGGPGPGGHEGPPNDRDADDQVPTPAPTATT